MALSKLGLPCHSTKLKIKNSKPAAMSNEQKITTNIKLPNKDLETLKMHFPQCFDKDGNFQLEKFKNNLTKNEINFSTESYGLDWLGKSYARLLASDPATTLLKANETHNTQPENANAENLLLKGDNLEVLKHLANAYYEKVKMIYIDPPYNTGSDGFVYNDTRKFTVKELQNLIGVDEEKAKRILSFTQSKSNSHSAWLTFMYPRLYIAKQLLKDDGVIFVSIDDNEVAQLRLLMDEVFGEENFVAELIWQKGAGTQNDNNYVAISHEYILIYSKNKSQCQLYKQNPTSDMLKSYNLEDEFVNERGKYYLRNLNDFSIGDRPGLHYDIVCPDGNILLGKDHRWRCDEHRFKWRIEQNRIVFNKNKDGNWEVLYKQYLFESKEEIKKDSYGNILSYGKIPESLLLKIATTGDGTKDLKKLFTENYFPYPKPTKLLFHLLQIATKNSDISLDFFAGSGTTGDAVMQLNAEDGGNRKFILVQLPEEIDAKKNKTAYDFVKSLTPTLSKGEGVPTIFEITKERLLRAAKKINAGLDTKNTNLELQITKLKEELQTEETKTKIENLKSEITQNSKLKTQNTFKIFETTPIWEDYDFEAEAFNPQQELFDVEKLSEDDIKALLITWKTYDGIPLTQDLEPVDLSGYIAYYNNGRLYLMHKGFTTDSLIKLLEKIDNDKEFEPKSIIAFGYHFESKSLREISENVKTYNNKKKSDIDFITRY